MSQFLFYSKTKAHQLKIIIIIMTSEATPSYEQQTEPAFICVYE